MGKYTIKYARPLGEFDSKYGQKYWGRAEESDMDISFNLMNPVNFEEGDEIEYEEKAIKETSKGREYFQLRKVRKSSGSAGGDNAVSASPAIKEPAGSKPPVAAADSKYLKDVSDMKYRVWVKLLDKLDTSEAREIHKQKYASEAADFWEAIDYHTDELLRGIENTRSGEPKAPQTPPEASKAPSNYQFRKKDEVVEPEEDWVPTDEDYSG